MKKDNQKNEQVVYGVVKVSNKGQIIIPVELRKELNIQQGEQLVVTKNRSGDGIELLKMKVLDDILLSSRSYKEKRK